MDGVSRAYYEVCFERDYLKMTEKTFQDFFSELMEKRFPSDFQRVMPWGKVGDRKNDGYLKSKRMLFQVYAPKEMSARKAIAKIEEDFNGALPYWKDHFGTWVFVHNSRDGISPDIEKKLLDLQKGNPEVMLINWGFEELKQLVFELDFQSIVSLLGSAPSNNSLSSIGFEELNVVLSTIARQPATEEPDLQPVPKEKLTANALSENVEILIKAGMRKARLVQDFFNTWYDPKLGDEVAAAFNRKYLELKKTKLLPDEIFMKLQEFAGGGQGREPGYQAAVLAVLAYLFETCEIFERPTRR